MKESTSVRIYKPLWKKIKELSGQSKLGLEKKHQFTIAEFVEVALLDCLERQAKEPDRCLSDNNLFKKIK